MAELSLRAGGAPLRAVRQRQHRRDARGDRGVATARAGHGDGLAGSGQPAIARLCRHGDALSRRRRMVCVHRLRRVPDAAIQPLAAGCAARHRSCGERPLCALVDVRLLRARDAAGRIGDGEFPPARAGCLRLAPLRQEHHAHRRGDACRDPCVPLPRPHGQRFWRAGRSAIRRVPGAAQPQAPGAQSLFHEIARGMAQPP